MFQYIIRYSVRNKLLVGLLVIAIIIWGIYSFRQIPVDAVPDITNNQVQVITNAPTLAAQEVEQFITYPLELNLRNIPGVIEIRSLSRFGISVITVVFKDNINTYLARQLVDEKIKDAAEEIPKGFGKPDMAPITTGLGEIYQYVITPQKGYENKYDLTQLRTMQDWIVKRQLAGTEGVVEVSSFGGYQKQYEVAVNPQKLNSQGITIGDIFTALEENNQNTGASYIEENHSAYFIRGEGIATSLNDIENVVVKTVNGIPILVKDIAQVRFGQGTRYGAMTRDTSGEVVGGIVMMLKGANSDKVIKNVKERIAVIQKSLPEGLVIQPFLDRTRLIDKTFHTVGRNLVEGALIVIFVLVLLVGNLRAGLIIASVIPLSMLFALILMNIFGVSANLMSLGAIDFGLIVDGAVIIVEGVLHYLHSRYDDTKISTEEMNESVISSSASIMKSAAFGIIIILIVYVPILSLVGIEGKMFRPMAQTVGFALIGALIFSLTYVPMMSSLALSRKIDNKPNLSYRIISKLENLHEPILKFALRRKVMILISAIALLTVSIILFMNLGGEFIPTLEEGDFAVEYRTAQGSSLTQTIETEQKASRILMKNFPEVKEIVGKLGTAEIATDPMPIETGDMIVVLKDKSEWTSASDREELAGKMKEALSILPGASFNFQQPIQMRFNELISGVRSDIAIKIFGDDLDILNEKGKEATDLIRNIKGVGDIKMDQLVGQPQILIHYKRAQLAHYGLTINTLNETVRAAMAGEQAGVIFEGEKRFDLVVRFENTYRKSIEDLRDLYIRTPKGAQIPLRELADIDFKDAPAEIDRENARRRIVIAINVRNRDIESLIHDIQATLDKRLKLPAGYTISYGGQFQNLQEAKSRLSFAVPVALLLIFMLLFMAFRSVKESILIFTAIPFSATGGVLALLLRGMPFSISAGIGFIALFGVAVLNGIVLISYFNKLKEEGVDDVKERVLKGTRTRLRPVLMTASVASLGFLPMAISTSAGAEVQRPLATVVIGGLITSTILTLVVLPVLYSIFAGRKKKQPGLSGGAVALLFLVAVSFNCKAQTVATSISIEQAMDTAVKNNPAVVSAKLGVEQQRQLYKTSLDLPKTFLYRNTEGEGGTGAFANTYYGITQEFALPNVYMSQAKVLNENIRLSEYSMSLRQFELRSEVRQLYYNLVNNYARLKLYQSLDSIYAGFVRAADLKLKTGESNKLESLAASAKQAQVKIALTKILADISVQQKQLQLLLNTKTPVTVLQDSLTVKADRIPVSDSLSNGPQLTYSQQSIEVARAQWNLEKSKLSPDISLGYALQQLKGYGTYPDIYAGINVPLWFRPQQGRIQAAKTQVKIAEANYQNNKLSYFSNISASRQEYLKYKSVLQNYEKQDLVLADALMKSTNTAYAAGEIGYIEHIQNIEQAINIRLNYLDAIGQYNQSLIQYYFLIGQ
jgi:cobalt-zinc-cadmium resistance protein CzcA